MINSWVQEDKAIRERRERGNIRTLQEEHASAGRGYVGKGVVNASLSSTVSLSTPARALSSKHGRREGIEASSSKRREHRVHKEQREYTEIRQHRSRNPAEGEDSQGGKSTSRFAEPNEESSRELSARMREESANFKRAGTDSSINAKEKRAELMFASKKKEAAVALGSMQY